MKVLLFFLLTLFPLRLLADEINSPFVQQKHQILVDLKPRSAWIRIERIFKNTSKLDQELEFIFSLPSTATILNLRIFEEGRWRKAETMGLQEAFDSYGQIAQSAKTEKKGTSLLLSKISADGKYRLFASPIKRAQPLRISYDIEIPFEYRSGKYFFPAQSLFSHLPNSKPIRLKTKDRFLFRNILREPKVVYSIVENECEKFGVPLGCQIREIEIPFMKDPIFSAHVRSRNGGLHYLLIRPSQTEFENAAHLSSLTYKKGYKTTIREALIQEIGTWRFVVWNEGNSDGDFSEIKIGNGRQSYFPSSKKIHLPGNIEQNISDILILPAKKIRSKNRKTKAYVGQLRLAGYNFLEVNLEVGDRLSSPPDSPFLIFIIDTSLSQGFLGVERQLNIAKAITGHVKGYQTRIVSYHRDAQTHGNLTSFSKAFREKSGAFLGNGSNLDKGLILAAKLEKEEKKRPVLIYAMTDNLLKKSYHISHFLKPLKNLRKSTTLHLLNVQESEGLHSIKLSRNDKIPFAEMARAHLGVAVDLSIPSVFTPNQNVKNISTRYLTRPDRLEEIEVYGWEGEKRDVLEGEKLTMVSGWGKHKTTVLIKGKLWNQSVSFSAKTTPPENRRALLSYAASKRITKGLKQLGKKGKLVSLSTSFYKPGAAKEKKTARLDLGFKQTKPTVLIMPPTGLFFLDGEKTFSKIARVCARPGNEEHFTLKVETTLSEIVAISPGHSPFSICIVEGIWKTVLSDKIKTGVYTFDFSSMGKVGNLNP